MTRVESQLLPVCGQGDIPLAYRDSAVADLLAYHNLHSPQPRLTRAELLVGMCMDNRMHLRVPEKFAYVMRSAGANFRGLDFQVSFAIAIGGVRAIALIGHNLCSMSALGDQREALVAGLVDAAGWDRDIAEQHFDAYEPRFEIGDPIEFTLDQARHVRQQFPRLTVAPLLYLVDDGMLYVIDERTASTAPKTKAAAG